MKRSLGLLSLTVVLVSLTAGCTSTCGSGADSPADAAKGMIEVATSNGGTEGACRYAAEGFEVRESDLKAVREAVGNELPSDLTYSVGDQMGTDVPVFVTSSDGTVNYRFNATSDEGDSWTLYFGREISPRG